MLASPENTNVSCPLVLLEVTLLLLLRLELDALAEEDGLRSIQGTATCLPPVEDKLLPKLELLPEELLNPEEVPEELLPGLVLLDDPGLVVLLDDPGLVLLELPEGSEELPDDEPLGDELLPLLELSDRIAKSIRPEVGLMMVSLIVPRVSPEEPVTLAPIN